MLLGPSLMEMNQKITVQYQSLNYGFNPPPKDILTVTGTSDSLTLTETQLKLATKLLQEYSMLIPQAGIVTKF
jgi:hypothetical protein